MCVVCVYICGVVYVCVWCICSVVHVHVYVCMCVRVCVLYSSLTLVSLMVMYMTDFVIHNRFRFMIKQKLR